MQSAKRISFLFLTGFMLSWSGLSAQKLVLLNYNDGNKVVNDAVISIDTSDLTALELNAHLKIQNNTDRTLAVFMKKIINQAVDSTSNYFCLNPKCWPDADSTDIADSIPAGVADSSFVTHYDHYFRYERPIPPGFTSITYLFYDYTTFPEPIEARVTINYHISGVGIPEIDKNQLTLFPVPASNQLWLTLPANPANPVKHLIISDVSGKKVREQNFASPLNQVVLDITGLSDGIYIASILSETGGITAKRFIVAH